MKDAVFVIAWRIERQPIFSFSNQHPCPFRRNSIASTSWINICIHFDILTKITGLIFINSSNGNGASTRHNILHPIFSIANLQFHLVYMIPCRQFASALKSSSPLDADELTLETSGQGGDLCKGRTWSQWYCHSQFWQNN
ncbi:hypothetical protein HAX54_011310 [Datura stramonium]|uniref:Uncharacterized protein n=1 Tax=Datura stramonium TaxID=4076 RepID=A0ABS8TJB4_DATST|nr:hypothetical protein [Datura stramonium]